MSLMPETRWSGFSSTATAETSQTTLSPLPKAAPEVDAEPFSESGALTTDGSPFGLQGLTRDEIRILKPSCIKSLAVELSLRATKEQAKDLDYINRILDRKPGWVEEYRVVHLLEKSLWIQGRSDLVMTMTKNPSQIPDNPPPKVLKALSQANRIHPQATVWYCVPLFTDQNNVDGLPIPITGDEVRTEAAIRLAAAVKHAQRFGWIYRSLAYGLSVPQRSYRAAQRAMARLTGVGRGISTQYKNARRDARRRTRATIQAQLEKCKYGRSWTEVPEHTTFIGRMAEKSMETAYFAESMLTHKATVGGSVIAPFIAAPLLIAQMMPTLAAPVVIVSCDPFLFVELPEEPGELRHVSHWYWQDLSTGRKKLHLHV